MDLSHQTAAAFQTTHWSMIARSPHDPHAFRDLLRAYWAPIYAFLRRSGMTRDLAADLTQEFIAQVILERDLFARADPSRGRFRTLLKASLRNFVVDQHRRASAHGRQAGRNPLGGDALDSLEPAQADDPGLAFDRQWAATLLSLALQRLAQDCSRSGQAKHWALFESAVVRPALGSTQPLPLERLAVDLDIPGAEQASSMIQTVRRKFRRILRDVVAETASAGQAQAELDDLRRFLTI